MIIFHPDPMECFNEEKPPETVKISLPSGGLLIAEKNGEDSLKVCGVISTDPMDYLNADWQPGSIIKPEYTIR